MSSSRNDVQHYESPRTQKTLKLLDMREWLEGAMTAAGATVDGLGTDLVESRCDLFIDVKGHKYIVTIQHSEE